MMTWVLYVIEACVLGRIGPTDVSLVVGTSPKQAGPQEITEQTAKPSISATFQIC
jgi:hypothetical protein